MNERIKELLEQAGVKYVTMPKDTVYEKFAELIVQDVFDCIADERFEVYEPVIQKVKQHFGIEE
jgi:hypothetical protein